MIERTKDKLARLFAGIMLVLMFVTLGWGISLGAIIGNNTIEATDEPSFAGRGFATSSLTAGNNDGIYTAITDDAVDTLVWYGDWGTDGTDLTVVMAIFTVVNDSIPGNLVDSASVTVNSGTKQFWPVVVNIPLTNGVKYIYAWVAKDNHSFSAKRLSCTECTSQSLLAGGPFVSPWSDLGTDRDLVFTGYANVINTPSGDDRVMILK